MAELSLENVSLSFGGSALLDGIGLQVEAGERIGLLGRNGSGKSTLLRVLLGEYEPDEGSVSRRKDLVIAGLEQEVPRSLSGPVGRFVSSALPHAPEWEVEKNVDRVLSWLALDPTSDTSTLSAGNQRRVLLARALVREPDLLLLDEPTNHLDVQAIEKLEEALLRRKGALIFVTHDRAFLRRLATRILELDRGKLTSHDGDLESWLERREAALEAEERANAEFDKKLAKEEAWLRRGVKARRTRNMGRVRALDELRKERASRRDVVGTAKGELREADVSGQLVLRAEGLGHSFGEHRVLDKLDLEIRRGDRIGLVGPNGCGKTTLIRLLLGELTPSRGTVRLGTNLAIGRFDQLHRTLDPDKTLQENVCPQGGDTVMVGDMSRHVIGYLGDFLFTPDQVRAPVRRLSGGERNRLQLACLLARPCNLLVLDEPTNDLDLETLELLEGLLLDYSGTLLLVSHDREFLDHAVTSLLIGEGNGRWTEHVGGWTDWRSSAGAGSEERPRPTREKARASKDSAARPAAKLEADRRLTFTERHELERLPARIEELEARKAALETKMSEPGFFAGARDKVAETTAKLEAVSGELAQAYARWEALETIAEASRS